MKPTVEQIAAALRAAGGGTTYPPVKMDARKRHLIQGYIDMGLSAQEIADAILKVQKAWWQHIGFKMWKRNAK